MKKIKDVYLVFILISCCLNRAYGQALIQINMEQNDAQVTIASDQVLEVQLPAHPSAGYAWYLVNSNDEMIRQTPVVEQAGDWEFISDDPTHGVGASGKQIIHFIAKEAGKSDLYFAYIRPWLKEPALRQYHVAITSDGAYTGNYEIEKIRAPEINSGRSTTLPSKFSWVEQQIMTPIPNPTSCGSSWAFAACAQFEANIKRFDHVVRNLSEQWLINCDEDKYNCDGGMYPGNMFQKYGAVYEADAPFKGMTGTCAPSYPYHEKIMGYHEIATTPSVEQLKEAIYTYGPVWAGVVAGQNFVNYRSGVLTTPDAGEINHAIVLVGWNDSTNSFVLRNSWGTAWGEGGYMRIAYGLSKVGEHASYIIYKDSTTGVDPSSELEKMIAFYPNPMTDRLTIQWNNPQKKQTSFTIILRDVQGRMMFSQDVKSGTNVEINTQAFSKGVYFLTIASETQSINYKLVK